MLFVYSIESMNLVYGKLRDEMKILLAFMLRRFSKQITIIVYTAVLGELSATRLPQLQLGERDGEAKDENKKNKCKFRK